MLVRLILSTASFSFALLLSIQLRLCSVSTTLIREWRFCFTIFHFWMANSKTNRILPLILFRGGSGTIIHINWMMKYVLATVNEVNRMHANVPLDCEYSRFFVASCHCSNITKVSSYQYFLYLLWLFFLLSCGSIFHQQRPLADAQKIACQAAATDFNR